MSHSLINRNKQMINRVKSRSKNNQMKTNKSNLKRKKKDNLKIRKNNKIRNNTTATEAKINSRLLMM